MPTNLPQLDTAAAVADAFAGQARQAVEVVGPWGSAKSVIAVQTAQALGCPLLIVAPGRIEAEAILEDLITFAGEDRCALFPAWEVLPTDAMAPADDIVAERMNTLMRLTAEAEQDEPLFVVAPVRALLQSVMPRQRFTAQTTRRAVGG